MTQIEIAGVSLRLTYGMHTLERLLTCDAEKFNYANYYLSRLIAYAHENYCKGHDMDPLLDAGAVFDYLEDNLSNKEMAEQLLAVATKWNESQPAKALNEANEQLKKKVAEAQTGEKLDSSPTE